MGAGEEDSKGLAGRSLEVAGGAASALTGLAGTTASPRRYTRRPDSMMVSGSTLFHRQKSATGTRLRLAIRAAVALMRTGTPSLRVREATGTGAGLPSTLELGINLSGWG